jgi:hypothetical protein
MTHLINQFLFMNCVYRLTNKLKNKKACALDSVTNEIITVAFKTLPCYFTKLFNTILSHGIFPSSWTKSFIVYTDHKSGDTADPNNYKRICIGSCLGKLLTLSLIMNTRLNNFLEENRISNNCQIGHRNRHRTVRTTDHIVLKTLMPDGLL